jgi:3-oxoacyl-[acyl-carrier protein] reductase
MDLNNKVAVITGGSRGIGKSMAELLARKGAKVVICARGIEALEKVGEAIQLSGGICDYASVDLKDERQITLFAEDVTRKHKHIDILINNAGVGIYRKLIDSESSDWDSIINTNLRGPFLIIKAFAGCMIEQKSGTIINIASGAGRAGLKNLSIYCASKFGLIGLTKAMRKEFKDYGIDVFYICPGYTRTQFFDNFPKEFHAPAVMENPDRVAEIVLGVLNHPKKRKMRQFWDEMVLRVLKC